MCVCVCMCVCMCVHVMLSLYDRIEISASAAKCVTKVEEVFGGVLVSTLICRDCLIVSVSNCMRIHEMHTMHLYLSVIIDFIQGHVIFRLSSNNHQLRSLYMYNA